MKRQSENGAKWLARLEHPKGPAFVAYQDTGGIWTIGFGATFWSATRKVQRGDTLQNLQEALELYRAQCREFSNYASSYIPDEIEDTLTDPQFDALVSLCYNAGPGNLRKSPVLAAILRKAPDTKIAELWRGTCIHNAKGEYDKGIVARRYCEAVAWQRGEYIEQGQALREMRERWKAGQAV